MGKAERRARKKENHRTGEKALAAKAERAARHEAILDRQPTEEEVDDFFGAPITQSEGSE